MNKPLTKKETTNPLIKPRPVALIGIDNTLARTSWRDQSDGWEDYNQNSKCDRPVIDIVAMVLALHLDNWRLIGLTSRSERWRKLTMDWLLKNEIYFDELLMRANDDFGKAVEVKLALAQKRFPDLKKDVRLVVDDREDVLAAFNALGITTLLVHGGAE